MKKYLTISFLLLSTLGLSQNNVNYWYFGKEAGIIFDSAGVQPTSGQMYTAEGCASISDGCGLLFYTDGDTVWNRNHTVMLNGFGLGGQCSSFGRQSSTQSAIIVRQPKNDSLFYVFTTDCHEDLLENGLRYSIVNMASQNGLGEVVLKNQFLNAPVGEKVTAVKHDNGCDVWIVTHEYGTNAFYAYLLTDLELNTDPVISNAGQIHSGDTTYNNCVRGYLKASPNGEKLISVTPDGVYWYCDSILPELFSFNKISGQVTSDFVLPPDTNIFGYYDSWAIPFYGATFSPDNSKLYISSGFYGPHLFQYDLNAGTEIEIINSKTLINNPTPALPDPCAMQIGPDGKIYVAQQYESYLGVINDPNSPGVDCNYIDSAVTLLPTTWSDWGGLPNFFDAYTIPTLLNADFDYSNTNVGDTTIFSNLSNGAYSYLWNFGDGDTSTFINPTHIYAEAGVYDVTLTVKDSLCNIDKHCATLLVTETTDLFDVVAPKIKFYPNPFQHSIIIDLEQIDHADIDIYSVTGQHIRKIRNSGNRILKVDFGQNLPSGIYFLNIRTSYTTITEKLIRIE